MRLHPIAQALPVIAVAMLSTPSLADDAVRVMHTPPSAAAAYEPVPIEARLPGGLPPERVAGAEVAVVAEDGELVAVPLSVTREMAFGEVPGSMVRPPRMRYFVRIETVEGDIYTAPPGAPETGLFQVPVEARSGEARDDGALWQTESVTVVWPPPGEVLKSGEVEIAAAFDPPLAEPWDAFVTLDGKDVTDEAEVTSVAFVLSPDRPLDDGPHRVTLSVVTPDGVPEASWVFFVGEMSTATSVEAAPTAYEEAAESWSVVGRVEVGWAVVAADTVSADSLDVYLPYDEVSRPTLDLYASGLRGDRSFLISAQYDPVYDDDLDWLLETHGSNLDAEVGRIFPSLSRSTLDWASGLGFDATARLGRTRTKVVAMRMTPADTLGGFGIYSRFAAGAAERYDWNEAVSTELVYVSVFDREGSIPQEQRLTDPLVNQVVAAIVRGERGALRAEVEVAGSSTTGEYEGSGSSVRAGVGLERDAENRMYLEYVTSTEDHYSGGSYENEPGESAVEFEFGLRPLERLKTSGWVRVARPPDDGTSASEDGYGVKLYGRAELSGDLLGRVLRTYVVARYDRTPYEDYDYVYSYAALGGSWRGPDTRVAVSVSGSRSRSSDTVDTWSGSVDVRRTLLADLLSARLAARWTHASGTEDTRYLRSHYTLETRWALGSFDVTAEYWLVERDDTADPDQAYTEHVVRVSVGRPF